MDNFKKYKNLYIIICCVLIIIFIVIFYFLEKNNSEDEGLISEKINSLNEMMKNEEDNNLSNNESKENNIYVHISGEIVNAGVYQLKNNSRIKDVIDMAGGLTEKADITKINLAYPLSDGIKIQIPNLNDKEEAIIEVISNTAGNNIIADSGKENNKININTASQSELESITGVGPSLAAKIIEYRINNGRFNKIEDLKKVTGIGESKYKSIEKEVSL